MRPNGKLAIKKAGAKGLGVFAKREFKIDELVIRGKPVSKTKIRTDHSFQIGFNQHVELDEPARLINHSCSPNLGIRNNSLGGYDFVAIKKINPGEELGWDYCTTEYISIAVKDKCLCESKNCRVIINGFKFLPEEVQQRYSEFMADYLEELPDR